MTRSGKTSRRNESTENNLPDLPRATEAERVIVGAVLANAPSNQHVLSKLSAECFFNKELACVFLRLSIMRKQGKTLDLPTLVDELTSQGELETAGGAPLVASYPDGIPQRLQLDSYLKEIRSKAILRRMAHTGEEIRDLALKSPTAREAVIAADKKISELRAALRSQEVARGDDSPAEILNDIVEIIRRFVAMSPAQTDIVALWVFHTHALEAADVTGYLSITSAEKRCGKTRLLEILELLVVQPWLTGRVTAAVLVRKIDALQPTLLLDESDTALRDDSEYSDTLRGVLNLGYRRGGKTSCCVGERGSLTYQDFSVFCPKAIAGIGSLPDTIADRSFPIRLQRRAPSERVERFQRSEIEKEAETLREIVAGCGSKNFDSLKSSKADQIEALGDRENEIAMPLLAIADVAGSDWPKRARRAMLEIFTGSIVRDESIGIRLLQDIQRAFDQGESEQISSSDLLEILNADEQAPWSEFSHGKPLNHRGLSRILAKYEIRPEHFRVGPKTVRGYRRASFGNAWTRYCGSAALESGTDGTSGTDSVFNDLDVPGKIGVPDTSGTDESRGTRILFKTNDVPDVPDVPVPKSVAAKVSE